MAFLRWDFQCLITAAPPLMMFSELCLPASIQSQQSQYLAALCSVVPNDNNGINSHQLQLITNPNKCSGQLTRGSSGSVSASAYIPPQDYCSCHCHLGNNNVEAQGTMASIHSCSDMVTIMVSDNDNSNGNGNDDWRWWWQQCDNCDDNEGGGGRDSGGICL